MTSQLKSLCAELTIDIQDAYEQGITLEAAEKLAAKFLYGQIQVAEALQVMDLDSRMKKNGLKAVKAAVYMENATKGDKKPSDVMLNAIVDRDDLVIGEQNRFDEAEVVKQSLENYYGIFKDAHIYFRGISKGRFE